MVCRLCLVQCDYNTDIFSDNNIFDFIAKFLHLQLSPEDPVSKVICELCWIELETFSNFYSRVHEAQKSLSIVHAKLRKEVNHSAGSDSVERTPVEFKNADSHLNPLNNEEIVEISDDEIVVGDDGKFDYFEIVELQKEEVIESTFSTPPQSNGITLTESITETISEKIRQQPERHIKREIGESACCRRRTRAVKHQEINKTDEINTDESIKVHIRLRRKKGVTKIRKGVTERSAKLWEKSREFDKIIKESIQLSCEICGVNLVDFRDLQRHFRRSHKIKGYAVCCDKRLYKRGLLVDHINTHNTKYNFCEICGGCPSSLDFLIRHSEKCINKIERLEDKNTVAGQYFEIVELEPNETSETTITTFESKNLPILTTKVEKQKTADTNGEEFGFICESAKPRRGRPRKGQERPKKAKSARSVKLWEKSKEFDVIIKKNMNLFCEICCVNVINFAELQRHFRRVHYIKGYAVCCNIRLYKRNKIVDHINAHKELSNLSEKGEQKLNSKRFRSGRHGELRKGASRADQIILKTMNLICDICNRSLMDFGELKRHFRRIHNQRGYVECCNIRLYKRNLLVDHIKWHEGQSYTCNICGKYVFSKSALEAHKNTCTKKNANTNAMSALRPLRRLSV